MSNPQEAGDRCVIVVKELFNKINKQRKLLKRSAIEERAMASRCTLKFNVDKKRGADFSAERIVVAMEDVAILEKIVNELFGVFFEGEVRKLCVKPKTPIIKPAPSVVPSMAMAPTIQREETGLLSKIKRLFGGK